MSIILINQIILLLNFNFDKKIIFKKFNKNDKIVSFYKKSRSNWDKKNGRSTSYFWMKKPKK